MSDRTQELLAEAREYAEIVDEVWLGKTRGNFFAEIADALERYQRRVIAHHELGTLSSEVLREWDGGPCPICVRADSGVI